MDPPPPEAPLALSLRQGLLAGLVRAVVTSAALTLALGRVGWPVAGAALGVATAAVEAWGRRRRLEPRTIALVAAWTAVTGAAAVAWGQLQGIYAVALLRGGSPSAARETALAAYRGLADARWRKDGLWFEALPWLEGSQANPRTPLLIIGAAAALTAAARLLRHLPLGRPRVAFWTRTFCSPLVLPPLGLLLAVIVVQLLERQGLADLAYLALTGRARLQEQAHLLAALGLALLAGFLIPLAASLSDLVALRPVGAGSAARPGPWSSRALALALLGLWLGLVTVPARGWPSTRAEGLAGLRAGSAAQRAAALDLLRVHGDLTDADVVAGALAASSDPDPGVRKAALQLLAASPAGREAWRAVLGRATDPDPGVNATAWSAAMELVFRDRDDLRRDELLAALRAALRHRTPAVRAGALPQAHLLEPRERVAALGRALKDPDPSVAAAALSLVASLWLPSGEGQVLLPDLRALLAQAQLGLQPRRDALAALASVATRLDQAPELLQGLSDPDPTCASYACWGVERLAEQDPAVLPALEGELRAGRRVGAARALAALGPLARPALPELRSARDAARSPVEREALEAALRHIEGQAR